MVASGNLGTIRIVAGMVSFTFAIFIIVSTVATIATASAATATTPASAWASSAFTTTSTFISAVGILVSVGLTDIESMLFGGLVGRNEQLEESHTFVKVTLKCRASQDVGLDDIKAISLDSSG